MPPALDVAPGPARPATWPARYRLHKYWSRKPGDAVGALVERHSRPGDVVLDPCCGSGVTPFEARVRGRVAVALDVNPFAVFLTEATLARCDPDRLAALGEAVLGAVTAREGDRHESRCRRCGRTAILAGTAWAAGVASAVLVRCRACGATRREAPDADDRRRQAAAAREGPGEVPRPAVFRGWQTRKLVRAGLRDFGELFTARNLRTLGALRAEIIGRADGVERRLLLLALTGALAQASRMMADHSAAGGGASWKLNVYWLPARSLELNPLVCFENRLRRVVAAKRETERLLAVAPGPDAQVLRADVRRLADVVEPGSVRYAFVDPPYGGEGIQYGELSALWCAWLHPPLEPALDEEVGCNPVRGRTAEDFARGLADAFCAVRRSLADDGRLTVTFASRDPRSWAALRAALVAADLEVVGAHDRLRSAPGLTERTSARATRHDAWLDVRAIRRP